MTVPASAEEVWRALGEIEDVAPCLPGAAIDHVDAETVYGSMTVKVGPVTVAYRGRAVIDERDDAHHRMVVHATGREQRGVGTARATLVVEAHERSPGTTEVDVDTDLTVTGRPAQFGRGVMADIGDRLIAEFADRLSLLLAAAAPDAAPRAGTPTPTPTPDTTPHPTWAREPGTPKAGPDEAVARAPQAEADERITPARRLAPPARQAETWGTTQAPEAAADKPLAPAPPPAPPAPVAEGVAGVAPVPQAGSDEPLDFGPVVLPVLWRATGFVLVAAALSVLARRIRRRLADGRAAG
ncbi:SRPBCC family protein [Streptacidiphilus neutrinimicus]|uniref:SRPBCC family protein n=1 Tax=Streptacidiphilus neutrinimicus TaxID=105420 RepID=UPI0005A91A3D|nr:SRPBCC family protein [Streptacidiphilus neutrinimicus]